MMRSWFEKRDPLVASLVGLGSFILYVLTLSPGVEGGDPGEFQFVPYILGIPHQTGYPLYVLLGKLWSILPLGSVAYRMNLFSALFASLTLCLTYLLLRLLLVSPWAAIFAALCLGLSRLFWLWATMAGVRTMNAFFFALILWTAFNWQKRPSTKWFYLLAFVFGLSLTHHRTAMLALPALLFVLWVDRGILSPRIILTALVSALVPLLLYLYIFVRGMLDPPFSALPLAGLRSLIDLVIAGGTLRSLRALDWSAALPGLSEALMRDFTPIGALLGALGGLIFFRRERKGLLFSLVIIFCLLIFTFSYDIGEGQVQWGYLILIYVPFALWIGMGIDGAIALVEKRTRGKGIYMLALVAMALVLAKQGQQSHRQTDHLRHAPLDLYRQDLRGEQAERFAASSLSLAEPGAVILSDWEQATPLLYYQLVEGRRADLIVHYPLDDWREWLARERPVYITRHFPPLLGMRNLTAVGPLVKLQGNPSLGVSSDIVPLGADFEGEMELVGYLFMNGWERNRTQPLKAGDILQVILHWRALTNMERDYSISLRLLDEKRSVFGQVDSVNPVLSLYPTHLWSQGEVVCDYYEILLPKELPEGLYHLDVLVYLNLGEGKFHNLAVASSEPPTQSATIGPFMVYR